MPAPRAERFHLKDRPPADGSGTDRAHRPDKGEGIGPARLPAGAGREEHEVVGAGRDRLLGMTHGGDVGEDETATGLDPGRAADARDDERRPVLDDEIGILRKPLVRAVDDEVRCKGCRPRRSFRNSAAPVVELVQGSAVCRRKRSDDAAAAGRDHKVRSLDPEHRRGRDRCYFSRPAARIPAQGGVEGDRGKQLTAHGQRLHCVVGIFRKCKR